MDHITDEMKEAFGKMLGVSHLMWENDAPPAFLPEWDIWKNGYQAGGMSEEFKEALRLLWFFLPQEEPASPHSNRGVDKEKNKRWYTACDLYQKYAGQL